MITGIVLRHKLAIGHVEDLLLARATFVQCDIITPRQPEGLRGLSHHAYMYQSDVQICSGALFFISLDIPSLIHSTDKRRVAERNGPLH